MSKYAMIVCSLLLAACGQQSPFHQVSVKNPQNFENKIFLSYENTSSPKFAALREKYQLDTIFHGETDEFRRVLMIRNWIKQHIHIDDVGPYPEGSNAAEKILDEALKGQGYHCGHYMIVQNAIMNSYGYVTRCLGAGPGVKGVADGHHGINEVWLNSYHKWFLCDAKYNSHFEKNHVPLSALEIRDEYLKNKGADIELVQGLDRKPITFDDEVKHEKEYFTRTYTWIEWNKYNDKYTNFPIDSSLMIVYGDNFFKNNTWIWDGKPHWAYNTPHMTVVEDRKALEWTPNTITSKVNIEGNAANIQLASNTPNLKSYQMKSSSDDSWVDVPADVKVELTKNKNSFAFRSMNASGIAGAEHQVLIER